MKQFIIALLFLSLLGTMTNLIYVSPISDCIILLIPIIGWRLVFRPTQKFYSYLWLYTIYSIINLVLYDYQSLFDFSFYRYDGNYFISYTPLLIFPFFCFKFNLKKCILYFLYITFVIYSILYAICLVETRGAVLLHPFSVEVFFRPLFKAHNAAGGFYSILFSLVIGFYISNKEKKYLIMAILASLFLWGSGSRGSMLGAACSTIFLYLYLKKKEKIIKMGIGIIIIVQVAILCKTFPYYMENIKGNLQVSSYIGELDWENGIESGQDANVYIRAYECWPRAIYLFTESPLFGTGYGSADDAPFSFSGIPHFISFNTTHPKTHSDSHAHHSYLHILGEEGIVGLTLFLLFWINLYKYITSKQRNWPLDIKYFLILSFFNLTIMSFTENRITTPSNALPFVLILCMAIIYDNSIRKVTYKNNQTKILT